MVEGTELELAAGTGSEPLLRGLDRSPCWVPTIVPSGSEGVGYFSSRQNHVHCSFPTASRPVVAQLRRMRLSIISVNSRRLHLPWASGIGQEALSKWPYTRPQVFETTDVFFSRS